MWKTSLLPFAVFTSVGVSSRDQINQLKKDSYSIKILDAIQLNCFKNRFSLLV